MTHDFQEEVLLTGIFLGIVLGLLCLLYRVFFKKPSTKWLMTIMTLIIFSTILALSLTSLQYFQETSTYQEYQTSYTGISRTHTEKSIRWDSIISAVLGVILGSGISCGIVSFTQKTTWVNKITNIQRIILAIVVPLALAVLFIGLNELAGWFLYLIIIGVFEFTLFKRKDDEI